MSSESGIPQGGATIVNLVTGIKGTVQLDTSGQRYAHSIGRH
jgi:hypothetical protein